jgi:hypothetical protein
MSVFSAKKDVATKNSGDGSDLTFRNNRPEKPRLLASSVSNTVDHSLDLTLYKY